MNGYMEAVLQRQDKANCLRKFETFEIENASRRSLKELMDHFEDQRKLLDHKIDSLKKDHAELLRLNQAL